MHESERIEDIKIGMVELFSNTITHNDTLQVYRDSNDAYYLENNHNNALLAVVEKGAIKMKKSSYFTDYVLENIAKRYNLNMKLLDDFNTPYRIRRASRVYPNWSGFCFSPSAKKFVSNPR